MKTKYQKYFADHEGYLMNPHLYTDKPAAQRLFEGFLNESKDRIKELQEFKKCIDITNNSNALKNNSKFTEVWGDQYKDNFNYFFSTIWKVLKSSYEKGDFDEAKFAKEYGKLHAFFYNEKTTLVQVLVPLHNLKCTFGNVDLTHLINAPVKISLRSMTDEDRVFLISVTGGYSSDSIISLHQSDFILELEYYDKFYSEIQRWREDIEAHVTELITALRLLKKGYVGPSLILLRHPLIDKTITLRQIDYDLFSLWPSITNQGEMPYVLNESEINTLQTILQLLRKISDNNKGIPIRHFNSSYEKTNKADKFLDLMITCEALFSDSEKDSLTHKVAWRFSRLLWENAVERKKRCKEMKDLYSIRSKLVHGNEEKVDDKEVEEAENHMRNSIKGYICEMNNNSFTQKQQFLNYLDFAKTDSTGLKIGDLCRKCNKGQLQMTGEKEKTKVLTIDHLHCDQCGSEFIALCSRYAAENVGTELSEQLSELN